MDFRWRETFDAEENEILEYLLGDELATLGYLGEEEADVRVPAMRTPDGSAWPPR